MTTSSELPISLNHEQSTTEAKSQSLDASLSVADQIEPYLVGITLAALVLGIALRELGGAEWLITAMAVISYIAGGAMGLKASLESLREGQINVDLLMILAAIGAAIIGSWPEGATLLFLFSFSNLLQNYAMDRSR